MDRLIFLTLLLTSQISFGGDLDKAVRQITDSLKSIGVEKVFVYEYSLFNGRYDIPYDDNELECDSIPTVAHIFWKDNGRWKCQRLDFCSRFAVVDIKADFDDLPIDPKIKFRKQSAHFTRYQLTKIHKEEITTVYVSGAQIREDKNLTVTTFKKIKKVIQRLEDKHKFKRVR